MHFVEFPPEAAPTRAAPAAPAPPGALTPREAITLRRIAHGSLAVLDPADLARLRALHLIRLDRGTWQLTPLGLRRYQRLPKPAQLASAAQMAGLLSILARSRPPT
jgi:hypothetical protein